MAMGIVRMAVNAVPKILNPRLIRNVRTSLSTLLLDTLPLSHGG
jgi:hypothetical protein